MVELEEKKTLLEGAFGVWLLRAPLLGIFNSSDT